MFPGVCSAPLRIVPSLCFELTSAELRQACWEECDYSCCPESLGFFAGLLGYSSSLINTFIEKKRKKEKRKLGFLLLLISIFHILYAWQTLSACCVFQWTGSIQRVNTMKDMRGLGVFWGSRGLVPGCVIVRYEVSLPKDIC